MPPYAEVARNRSITANRGPCRRPGRPSVAARAVDGQRCASIAGTVGVSRFRHVGDAPPAWRRAARRGPDRWSPGTRDAGETCRAGRVGRGCQTPPPAPLMLGREACRGRGPAGAECRKRATRGFGPVQFLRTLPAAGSGWPGDERVSGAEPFRPVSCTLALPVGSRLDGERPGTGAADGAGRSPGAAMVAAGRAARPTRRARAADVKGELDGGGQQCDVTSVRKIWGFWDRARS